MSEYILSEIADVIDCEHKTAPKVDSSNYCSVRTTDIANGKIDYENANRVSEETYTEWTKRATPEPEDIVLAREAPVGEVGWVKDGYKVCLGQRTVLIKVTHSEVFKKFLLYHLVNPESKYELRVRSGGSVVAHLNMKDIRNFKLSLPSFPEQKAIAQVLSSLDDKIDLLHRQNKTLEAIAETLFRQWFIEEAQDDWEEGNLGDVIDIFDGKRIPLSKMERNKRKDGFLYPYYGASKVMDYINDYIFDGDHILLGEDGTVRTDEGYPVLQYATGKFWANNHTHVLRAKAPFSNFFLWNYLIKKNIDEIITGAVQPKINQGNLKSLEFPKFPERLVTTFNETTEPILAKIKKNKIQEVSLEKLRDTLLPKLMSGEVRVAVEPNQKAA
ncbi:MAG: restriction endonuclease subunit S [Phormidesmis sp.]